MWRERMMQQMERWPKRFASFATKFDQMCIKSRAVRSHCQHRPLSSIVPMSETFSTSKYLVKRTTHIHIQFCERQLASSIAILHKYKLLCTLNVRYSNICHSHHFTSTIFIHCLIYIKSLVCNANIFM